MKSFTNIVQVLDVSKHISNHIVGEHHTIVHRRATGISLMVLGVSFVKVVLHTWHLHLILDILVEVFGYSVHAVGFIPFATKFEKQT